MANAKRHQLPEITRWEQACLADKLSSISFYEEILNTFLGSRIVLKRWMLHPGCFATTEKPDNFNTITRNYFEKLYQILNPIPMNRSLIQYQTMILIAKTDSFHGKAFSYTQLDQTLNICSFPWGMPPSDWTLESAKDTNLLFSWVFFLRNVFIQAKKWKLLLTEKNQLQSLEQGFAV